MHQQQQAPAQQIQAIQSIHQPQQQHTANLLPTATQIVPPPVTSTFVNPVATQPAPLLRPTSQQLQAFKQSAAKAGKSYTLF